MKGFFLNTGWSMNRRMPQVYRTVIGHHARGARDRQHLRNSLYTGWTVHVGLVKMRHQKQSKPPHFSPAIWLLPGRTCNTCVLERQHDASSRPWTSTAPLGTSTRSTRVGRVPLPTPEGLEGLENLPEMRNLLTPHRDPSGFFRHQVPPD